MMNKVNLKFWKGFRIWVIRDADGKPIKFFGIKDGKRRRK